LRFIPLAGGILGAVLLMAGLTACAGDSPLGADSGTLDPGQRGKVVQATFTEVAYDTTFPDPVATGDSPLLLVGRLNETETRFLLRFQNLPDSVVVNSAELVLFARRAIGSGADFDITLHKVTADWQESDVTDESFKDSFDPQPVGMQTVSAADSDTVVVAIDTTLVTGWTDGSIENDGLLVQFNDATFIKTFLSRHTSGGNPELRLRYTAGGATVDSTFFPTADAFLARRLTDLPAGLLYVGNGIADRAALRIDVATIPATATVNRAKLRFTLAPEQSVLTPDPLILGAFPLALPLEPGQPVVFDSTFRAPQFFLYDTTSVVELDVTDMVQAWVTGERPNQGLTVRSLVANRDIARVAFESRLASDSALRPRLEVDYTLPPYFGKSAIARDE